MARLDGIARELLQQRARRRAQAMRAGDFAARPWAEQARTLRGAVVCPYMIVYRTEADLRAFDLSLDPSERDAGSLFSYRPDLTNYMEFGFARVQTPRAWLSTWSGLSSNADVVQNAAQDHRAVAGHLLPRRQRHLPVATRAPSTTPSAPATSSSRRRPAITTASASARRSAPARRSALAQVVDWLRERFRTE